MNSADAFPERQIEIIEMLRNRMAQHQSKVGNRRRPLITLTYAQSLDGSIAPFEGGTLQLSNPESHRLTHQVRALHDAILVGVNTVLCDDPRLTVRLTSGENPQPIVLDSQLRFPLDANLLRDPCVRPMIATGESACENRAQALIAAGARVIRVPLQDDGLVDLSKLLPRLSQMGIESVMVEGGGKVITSVLATGIADQLLLAIAPRFVGGLRAVNPTEAWVQMPQLSDVRYQLMAGDLIVWGQLRSSTRSNGAPFAPTAIVSNTCRQASQPGNQGGDQAHNED